VSTPASFSAVNLGPATALPVPPVDGVNARFLMNEVPGRTVVAALRLRYDGGQLGGPSTLRLESALSASADADSVTEAFKLDEVSGVTELVGAWHGREPVVIPDLSETLEHARADGTQVRSLKVVFLRARQSAYDRTCRAQGGDPAPGWCSFANKPVAPRVGPQVVRTDTRVISWNIGNIAYTCGGGYNQKVCYIATLRRIADTFSSLEQSGKPGIILLQEMWHGRCTYNTDTDTSKLCSSAYNYHTAESIIPILGLYGLRYAWRCTNPVDVPSASLVINGYECIAVDPAQYTLQGGDSQVVQPSCVPNPDPTSKYQGRDTGFQIATVFPVAHNTLPIKVINGHLAGTNASDCRATELNALNQTTGVRIPVSNLIGGDFNTDPRGDTSAGGTVFNAIFTPFGSAPYDDTRLAKQLDDPSQTTAYYYGYYPSLDHVLSDRMGGTCSRGPQYDGTDHVYTDCRLYQLFTN